MDIRMCKYLRHLYGQVMVEDIVPRILQWNSRMQPDNATIKLHLMSIKGNEMSAIPDTLEVS